MDIYARETRAYSPCLKLRHKAYVKFANFTFAPAFFPLLVVSLYSLAVGKQNVATSASSIIIDFLLKE